MPDVAETIDAGAETLTRKVGPLPAWAWAGMAVAGVTAVILIRRRLSGGTVSEPAEPGAAGEPGDVLDEMTGGGFSLPGGFVIGGGPTQATGSTDGGGALDLDVPQAPDTNGEWQTRAARYLIGRGYQGTVVTDALGRYLSGRPLNAQGAAIIDAAIAAVGAPPQPVPPATVSPTPEPVPSPGGGGTAPKPKPKPKPKPISKPATVTKTATRTAAPPKPKPKPAPPADKAVKTLAYGDTLYRLYRDVYGHYPSVAQIRAIAAYNGLSVGGAPNYIVTPWRTGQAVKFPTTEP